jgi:hypothetical protein
MNWVSNIINLFSDVYCVSDMEFAKIHDEPLRRLIIRSNNSDNQSLHGSVNADNQDLSSSLPDDSPPNIPSFCVLCLANHRISDCNHYYCHGCHTSRAGHYPMECPECSNASNSSSDDPDLLSSCAICSGLGRQEQSLEHRTSDCAQYICSV